MTDNRIPDGGEVEAAIGLLSKAGDMGYINRTAFKTLLASYRSLTEQVAGLTRTVQRREHQIKLSGAYWQRAAEEALAGDPRALRNRVEMRKMGPVEIVQSDADSANALEAALAGREGFREVLESTLIDWRALANTGALGAAFNVKLIEDALSAAPALTASGEEAKPDPAGLVEAVSGIGDDFMTSEKHHPGYVLIPTAKFEAIRQALAEHRGAK